jgi:hypothetical protein
MRYSLPWILVLVALSACSPALVVDPPPPLVANNGDVACTRRAPTGTIRTRTVCTTAAEREQQRREAMEAVDEARDDERAEAMRRQRENFPTSRGE